MSEVSRVAAGATDQCPNGHIMNHEVVIDLRPDNISGSVQVYFAECKWCGDWNKSVGRYEADDFKMSMGKKECAVFTHTTLIKCLMAIL